MSREITFSKAINEATDQKMSEDESVYLLGLGAPDPKGLFGTTSGLVEKYGPDRVQDMPISENAMTGIAIGTAIQGMRPIMTHQRVDFSLLALDQLINNAAKWHYMFDGQKSVPMVVRMFIGRGWGQGPQHSQTLHSIFAHIPGLKVVMPSTCYDAKGLLVSAIEDNNTVIYLEHRWLHNITGPVPEELYRVPIGKANVVSKGTDITIVASSHMTLEAYRALEILKKEGVSAEVVDLRSVKPIDKETILDSVKKTGKLLVVDPDWKTCGFAGEILAIASEEAFSDLKMAPERLCYPDQPCPTSWALANHFYPTSKEIAAKVLGMLGKTESAKTLVEELMALRAERPLDVPDKAFTGPF
ncbi:MAG: Acetoin:2,6-dichlorophenolindophenol oxidoreductase subunit beta [Chlamydiia bacterium]|nr:Acetoin:2,6-dichlorophenolindophenol oxidoreductase subunit beta [Chlamydiia bacterium]MCH9616424.1 Acetoin:2,6-dichlorophenolindophenol oxidoreductase subunit beta [Chlamydiia bacterium]MCH9629590.1 Acetoin:2,6-dichlorophenolindophenol oxidoreductase subunit beta [Chlamydiia bacterium]